VAFRLRDDDLFAFVFANAHAAGVLVQVPGGNGPGRSVAAQC
jgi:hypothetical protein